MVVFLSPWAIRNYNSFGFLNVDPRFHRKMDYQEVILKKYRITDNALYQDMKGMSEYEKNQLFKERKELRAWEERLGKESNKIKYNEDGTIQTLDPYKN